MKFFMKPFYQFKSLVNTYASYIKSPFKHYVKFHIFILNKIVSNYTLYFIYILLLLYAYFGGLGQEEQYLYHFIAKFPVVYLYWSSHEMFLICSDPIYKEYLIKAFGNDYFVTHFPEKKLLFKYALPLFFLCFLEMLTRKLRYAYVCYLDEACTSKYEDLYGNNGLVWSDLTKYQYHVEQAEILSGSTQGLVCGIADDLTFLVNYLIETILNLV